MARMCFMFEIFEGQRRLQRFEWDRERRVRHLTGEVVLEAAGVVKVARGDREPAVVHEGRTEEWEAVDVIPMGMREQQRSLAHTVLDEILSEVADAGSGVHDNALVARENLEATRIAAVDHVIRRRTRDASADTPELDR